MKSRPYLNHGNDRLWDGLEGDVSNLKDFASDGIIHTE